MSILTIAHLTFLEARRRKLFWIVLVVGLLALVLFSLGFYFMYQDLPQTGPNAALIRTEFSNVLLLMSLYGVNSLGVMLAVLISADTIAGEIASGTIQTVVTKPLRRWEVVLGKWLGLAGMLAVFEAAMSAGMMAVVWTLSGYVPEHPFQGVGLMVLSGLVFLTISILGGTRLPTLGNGVLAFMLYGVAFVGGWVEQIGALVHSDTAVNIGIAVSLLVPGETLWRRAAYLLQPPVLGEVTFTPFGTSSAPSEAMVVYSLAYVAVLLTAAVLLFQRRDL